MKYNQFLKQNTKNKVNSIDLNLLTEKLLNKHGPEGCYEIADALINKANDDMVKGMTEIYY